VNEPGRRPFYTEYAWAFDAIIDRPVRKECAAIVRWLIERDVRPGAAVLDAGCGTGRYAIELARRGYIVRGVDRSPELIEVAVTSSRDAPGWMTFLVGDLLTSPAARHDAILCRGVLNDLLEDAERDMAFGRFADGLRRGGVLILDVREWDASEERKRREPLFRKRVSTDRGELTFTSVTAVDPERGRLLISEQHLLVANGREQVSDHEFVMRCWTRDELGDALRRHGFDRVSYFGAYDVSVPAGSTDRLVVVAEATLRQ
jgi:SAM-dependent methyltransferase